MSDQGAGRAGLDGTASATGRAERIRRNQPRAEVAFGLGERRFVIAR